MRPLSYLVVTGLLFTSLGCGISSDHQGDDGQADGSSDGKADNGDASPTCAAAEVCDGVADEDCDGVVDEDCGRCPLMTVSCPSGCCPVDSWQVANVNGTGSEIAVDPAGNIFYAYTIVSGGVWQSSLAIYDAVPGTWREMPLGEGTYNNRIRIDAMGRVHVANATNSSQNERIWYRRSDDHGKTFSAPIAIGWIASSGGFDMEVDSAGQPHVVYEGLVQSGLPDQLRYTHLNGTTWTTETLDPLNNGYKHHPDLELGFADRPHVVFYASDPPAVPGQVKRYLFNNGNQWIAENFDIAGDAWYPGDPYFRAQTLRLLPDGSREVLYTRHESGASSDSLLFARRGPLDADTWQISPITGTTDVVTPTMFIDNHGKHGAVSDGVRLSREDSGTSWTTTSLGVTGRTVAAARRGQFLYLAYSHATSLDGPPTLKVIDLGP